LWCFSCHLRPMFTILSFCFRPFHGGVPDVLAMGAFFYISSVVSIVVVMYIRKNIKREKGKKYISRVLAYHLLVVIEKTLLDKGIHTSWATVRETLQTHEVATVVLPTDGDIIIKIRKGSTPEPKHTELYRLLEVPKQIIRPKKIVITNAQM